MDDFTPEYVQAIDAARWNAWWYVAVVIPFVLLIPAAVKRRFGCVVFTISCVLSWFAFFFAVQYYWSVKLDVARTDREIADATADAASLLGPWFVGVPLVLVYVSIVAFSVYGVVALVRMVHQRQNHHHEISDTLESRSQNTPPPG